MPIKGTFTGAADVGGERLVDVQVRTLAPVAGSPGASAGSAAAAPSRSPRRRATAPAQAPITQS